jgi:hypothetical protein
MDGDLLFDLVRRLNVTLIATTVIDTNAQTFLEASPHFEPAWSNGLFTFFEPVGYDPAWVEAEQAAATVTRYDRRAIDVEVSNATPGATLRIKVANYALWQAQAEGRSVPIETDAYGLMRLSLLPGSYTLHLRYQPGWPERAGSLISLIAVLGAVVVGVKTGITNSPYRCIVFL